nr:MAG: hypothetical protein [Microviridae sp.]
MTQRSEIYNRQMPMPSELEANESTEGETIEQKIMRILNNNEPITDGAPQIFTERKNGVQPEFNIRTDRFDIAVEAMEHIHKSAVAKRMEGIKAREPKIEPAPKAGDQQS